MHPDAEGWRCATCRRVFPRRDAYVDFVAPLPPHMREKVETDFSDQHYALADEPYWAPLVAVTHEYSARYAELFAQLMGPPRRCLDIGRSLVADGRLKPHLRPFERRLSAYCVLDPDARQLACQDSRIFMARGIGEALPFADASFEIVLFHSALDHCVDYAKALDECGRVLVPGGMLSIVLNNNGSWAKRLARKEAERRRAKAAEHHNVFFSATGMVDELRGRGYAIVQLRGLRYLLLPASALNRLHRALGPRRLTQLMRVVDRLGAAVAPRLGGDFHLLARKG